MNKLEKAINDLPIAIRLAEKQGRNVFASVMRDALELLKAQEPIEPIEEIDYESDADGEERPYSMYYCRKCKEYIEIDQKYCDHCGQAVKWDG